jgi:thioredoxin reductase
MNQAKSNINPYSSPIIYNYKTGMARSDQIQANTNNNVIDDNIKDKNGYDKEKVFDIAIIGAGFAGLSAALLLGRYLRQTIVFDSGKPRTSNIHGYLGFENLPRESLIEKARKDLLQYNSITMIEGKVHKIEKVDNENHFLLVGEMNETKIEGDNNKREFKSKSRYLIIATGVEHIKPRIKNFEKFDGKGAWHCPHCDGFQSTNRKLGIIISVRNAPLSYAKEFLGWTKDILLFIQGEDQEDSNKNYRLSDVDKDEARALGITVIENDKVVEIKIDAKGLIEGVICESNRVYQIEILFYNLGHSIQNQLAKQMGCKLNEGYIQVDKKQQTTIQKVYAAGDIDTDRHYAILAAASGALAAIAIYEDMLKDAIKDAESGE